MIQAESLRIKIPEILNNTYIIIIIILKLQLQNIIFNAQEKNMRNFD